MKKVFSIEKFIAHCIATGDGTNAKEVIELHSWALECNHLTSQQINAIGYGTCDEWMIELPDPVPQPPTSESATSLPTPSCLDPLYGNRRVVSVVEVQGIPCRIKAGKRCKRCKGCILTGAPMELCYKYACSPFERMDSKNVSFVRIKRL